MNVEEIANKFKQERTKYSAYCTAYWKLRNSINPLTITPEQTFKLYKAKEEFKRVSKEFMKVRDECRILMAGHVSKYEEVNTASLLEQAESSSFKASLKQSGFEETPEFKAARDVALENMQRMRGNKPLLQTKEEIEKFLKTKVSNESKDLNETVYKTTEEIELFDEEGNLKPPRG